MSLYLFVNEGDAAWKGVVRIPLIQPCAVYDAWNNNLETTAAQINSGGTDIAVEIEPLKSFIVVFDNALSSMALPSAARATPHGAEMNLNEGWTRSLCDAVEYPAFRDAKELNLPDALAGEQPGFAGFVRYERHVILNAEQTASPYIRLEIADAYEGVELFVNGVSAGIRIAPPFRYNISPLIKTGGNVFTIEVATTLERQIKPSGFAAMTTDSGSKAPTGITGEVRLYWQPVGQI
jgi:hypothetical protein